MLAEHRHRGLLGKRIADAILADIASGAAIAEIKKPVEEMPVVLRSAGAVEDAANEAGQYDMADRRPGRSDDWLWLGATN